MTLTLDTLERELKALADANRLRILHLLLVSGELCVCDIERVLALPQSRVSRHLTVLRAAGLVTGRRAGQWMHYRTTEATPATVPLFEAIRAAGAHTEQLNADVRALRACDALACARPGAPLDIALPRTRTEATTGATHSAEAVRSASRRRARV